MTDIVERLKGSPHETAIGRLDHEAAEEIKRLRSVLRKLAKVRFLYSTYASGRSSKSYGQMIDDALRPNVQDNRPAQASLRRSG